MVGVAQLVSAPDCGSGGRGFESLYPPCKSDFYRYLYGGIAQLARAHGSYPWCRRFKSYSRYLHGILAQLGEHLPYKQRVTGSSPVGPICAGVAELADAQDLKSCGTYTPVSVRFRSPAYLNNLWA